jgi:ribokinase
LLSKTICDEWHPIAPWKRLQGYHVSRGDPAEIRETLNARIKYGGPGGKGLNQAIAAARAEMDVRLIAAVGNDSATSLIRDTLRAERIATDTLTGDPQRRF